MRKKTLLGISVLASIACSALAGPSAVAAMLGHTADGQPIAVYLDGTWSAPSTHVHELPPSRVDMNAYENGEVKIACGAGRALAGPARAPGVRQVGMNADAAPHTAIQTPGIILEATNISYDRVLPLHTVEIRRHAALGHPRFTNPEGFFVRDSYGNLLNTKAMQLVAGGGSDGSRGHKWLRPGEMVRYLVPLTHYPARGYEFVTITLPSNMLGNYESLNCEAGYP